MIRKVFLSVFLFATLLLVTQTARAQYGCTSQYGQYGGCPPSQNIMINKLVAKPGTSDFVDNLSPSDPRFGAGSVVIFRLIVKNTSDSNLIGVTVKDFVPTYIEPLEGPGNFDTGSRTISFSAGDLKPGEEKSYDLKMQVVAQTNLPNDKGLFCISNRAQAFNANVSDEDTAQLCIEKQITGVTQVPSTGPEFGLIFLASDFALLGAGLLLKKRV